MEDAPDDWGPPADAPAPEPAGIGLLEAPRRAQKIEISYARTAKKVDIKALKDDLWDTIDTINPAYKQHKAKGAATTAVEFMGETKQALPFRSACSAMGESGCECCGCMGEGGEGEGEESCRWCPVGAGPRAVVHGAWARARQGYIS